MTANVFDKENFEYREYTGANCAQCGKPSDKVYRNTKIFNVTFFCKDHNMDTMYKDFNEAENKRQFNSLFGKL